MEPRKKECINPHPSVPSDRFLDSPDQFPSQTDVVREQEQQDTDSDFCDASISDKCKVDISKGHVDNGQCDVSSVKDSLNSEAENVKCDVDPEKCDVDPVTCDDNDIQPSEDPAERDIDNVKNDNGEVRCCVAENTHPIKNDVDSVTCSGPPEFDVDSSKSKTDLVKYKINNAECRFGDAIGYVDKGNFNVDSVKIDDENVKWNLEAVECNVDKVVYRENIKCVVNQMKCDVEPVSSVVGRIKGDVDNVKRRVNNDNGNVDPAKSDNERVEDDENQVKREVDDIQRDVVFVKNNTVPIECTEDNSKNNVGIVRYNVNQADDSTYHVYPKRTPRNGRKGVLGMVSKGSVVIRQPRHFIR